MTPTASHSTCSGGDPLLRVLRGARLTHDGDADLTGIGQLLLDLLGNVAGDYLGADVVDVLRLDHDADLATRLHREHLLDARLLAGDLLDPLQPLEVVLECLAPRAGPTAADLVGSLCEYRLDGADLG